MIEMTIFGRHKKASVSAGIGGDGRWAWINGTEGDQTVVIHVTPAQAQQIFDTFGKWLGCGDEAKEKYIADMEAELAVLRKQDADAKQEGS